MRLKKGVRVKDIQPELLLGLIIFETILSNYCVECVVTSLNDGRHMKGSKHYIGTGADIRSRTVPLLYKTKILDEAKEQLDDDYDIILEGEGTLNEHYHFEYDPK